MGQRWNNASSTKRVLLAVMGAILLASLLLFTYDFTQGYRSSVFGCATADASKSASVSTGFGSAVSNLWNLQSASGGITLCYDPKTGLNSSASFSDVRVLGQPPNLVGYPEVGYGNGLEGGSFGSQAESITFRMTVSTFSQLNLISNTTFSTNHLTAGSIDIGYDFWIKGKVAGVTVSSDFEVMILFYFPFSCASYSSAAYQFTNIIYVDSRPTPETWTVCLASGGSNARLVQFTLTGSSQILSGKIALKPMEFIHFVEDRIHQSSLATYYIEGMELGTEFWSNSTNNATFQWSLTFWGLESATSKVLIVGEM